MNNIDMLNRLRRLVDEELYGLHLRLWMAQLLLAPLPPYVGSRLRARTLRLAGFQIGSRSILFGTPTIVGYENIYQKLSIGNDCIISLQCFLDLAARITIGNRAAIGPQVMLVTGTHQVGDEWNRLGSLDPRPIQIRDGVWLGARCTVLPGVTIGEGAVIAAGAVVAKDIPPHTLAAGVPATVVRQLPTGTVDSGPAHLVKGMDAHEHQIPPSIYERS